MIIIYIFWGGLSGVGFGAVSSRQGVLDVGFGEDASRKRTGNAAQNFSVINRIALKQDKSSKRGIKGKRLKAGWDQTYLFKLLGI